MRISLLILVASLAGCAAHAAPRDTVLVSRTGSPPLQPAPPPGDVVLSDPLPSDALPVDPVPSDPPPGDPLPGVGPAPAVASAAIQTTPGLRPQSVVQWTRTDLVPFQQWRALPGNILGVVWMAGAQPWGAGYEHSATTSRDTRRDEYKFGVDGTSPYAVYFESDGRGFNFLQAWTGGGRGTYDAAMFNHTTPNRWGLARRAHLVEVEVNGRRGARAGIHFVVTGARVLDGTPTYPPHIDEVLVALRQRFDAVFANERPELEGLYTAAVQNVGPRYAFGPPTREPVGVFPTWLSTARAIEVVFTAGVSGEGVDRTYQPGARGCPPCPPGAPCVECNRMVADQPPTATVHAGFAIRYRVDARGLIVAETRYADRADTSVSR